MSVLDVFDLAESPDEMARIIESFVRLDDSSWHVSAVLFRHQRRVVQPVQRGSHLMLNKELMSVLHADRQREIAENLRVRSLLDGRQPEARRDEHIGHPRPLTITDRIVERAAARAR